MGPGASPAQFPVPRALMWVPSFKLPTATSPARRSAAAAVKMSRRRRSVRLRKADRSAEYQFHLPLSVISQGSYVYDSKGNKYLDALAGLWCTALGGSEPRLVKAATDQLNKLPFYHSFWNSTAKPPLDLAEELISMFTAKEMGKVLFTNSGSEANDSQVKLVWYYNNALGRPNKKKIIAQSQALPAMHLKFDLPAPFVLHTDCTHYWRFGLPGEAEEEFATRLADNLENLILKEGPETVAAFIAEPVIGAGGVIPPPKTYFEKIQAVLQKYDVLFIADEVITGFGRLGTMFGSDLYNIKPDLVSLAKALSSAYVPIGATLVSPEISDVVHSQSNKIGFFAHGFTYSGHPVSCAVALEALKIYRERNIPAHVKQISPRFQEGIKAFAGSSIIGETRGVGLLLATEFANNKSPNDPFPVEWGVAQIFGAECKKRGMLVKVVGDEIAMSPPLIMSQREVDGLVSIYGEALKATEERVAELRFKGHGMLAPFTAGWQSTDVHPLVIERSEGSYVYDIDGKKYLDSLAGLWCTALGGSEPRLVKAATEQLHKLPFYHSFWNRTTKPSLDLAKELLSMFTAREMGKVFFTNSGSEANDSQVKLVWYYNNALGRPDKKKFIARSKSYHGSTLISASLSGLPALHQKFDLPAPFVLHTDCPHYWRFHLPGTLNCKFTIAAFIAEPVMGAGGVIPPPKTYFEKVQVIVKKYDILFIADEVITAFGRLGTMFGSDMYNIKPDLVSMAKALSSAYVPIGAIMVSPEISDVIHSQSNKLGSFAHGFTYSGHPVACAVAIEALKIYQERNIPDHVKQISPRFQEGVKAFAGSPIVGEIRGVGLILGTEFADNKSPNDPFPAEWGVGAIFGAECQKRGMLVRVAGDNIMMSPPLIMTPDEVEELVSIYGDALKATEERVAELKSKKNN
uniref:Uncharacterized protein n=1 Tax=Oryza barthii TaxID=65489 RepID=A0A0D3G0A5_9ORYZ